MMILWGEIPKAIVVVEDAKSGMSAKSAKECIMPEPLANPLDRMILEWEPPIIINPKPVTNVNP